MRDQKLRSLLEQKLEEWKNYVIRYRKPMAIGVGSLTILCTVTVGGYQYYKANQVPVYEVLLNDQKIGTVSDPQVVERWIRGALEDASKEFRDRVELELSDPVLVKPPEMVFRAEMDDAAVIAQLEQQVDIKANAIQLVINGNPVAVLPDQSSVDQLLKAVQDSYAPATASIRQVSTDRSLDDRYEEASTEIETGVKEITFVENIQTTSVDVSPDEVKAVEEAYQLIQDGEVEEKVHIVQEGDTLSEIAFRYGMKTDQLMSLNPDLKGAYLQIGDEVIVKAKEPMISVKTVEEMVTEVTVPYKTQEKKDSKMYKGEQKVIQQGQNGHKEVTYEVIKVNGIVQEKNPVSEVILEEPVDKVVVKGTKVVPARGTGDFAWPAVGGYISSNYGSRWGSFHAGIDIARSGDRTIKAADNGRVVSAGWDGGYGKCIIIDHGNGYRTRYAHLSQINVSVGQVVEQGQSIGVMGSTGNSTGVHLHFEVTKNGRTINPLNVL